MALKEKITVDMQDAMRSKDSEKLNAIRLLQSSIKQKEVDDRVEIDDTMILNIIEKMLKQNKGICTTESQRSLRQTKTLHAFSVLSVANFLIVLFDCIKSSQSGNCQDHSKNAFEKYDHFTPPRQNESYAQDQYETSHKA